MAQAPVQDSDYLVPNPDSSSGMSSASRHENDDQIERDTLGLLSDWSRRSQTEVRVKQRAAAHSPAPRAPLDDALSRYIHAYLIK
jgi:hypothetical protein